MKFYHRSISLVLCLFLLCFCLSFPLRSTASATAGFVSISLFAAGGIAIPVAPAIAVCAVLLVGTGFATGTIQDIVADATDFYNTASPVVKQWLDDAGETVAGKIHHTGEAISSLRMNTAFIDAVNAKLGTITGAVPLSPQNPFLNISSSTLGNLGSISSTDLFSDSIAGAIVAGNEIASQSLDQLLTLNTNALNLNSAVTNMKTVLSSDLGMIKGALSSMSTTMTNELIDLNTAFDNYSYDFFNLSEMLSFDLDSIYGSLSTIEGAISTHLDTSLSGVTSKLGAVNTSIGTLNTSLTGQLTKVNTALGNIASYQINARDKIVNELIKIGTYSATINTNMKDEILKLRELDATLNANIKSELIKTREMGATINTNMRTDFDRLINVGSAINNTLNYDLGVIQTTLSGIADPAVTLPDTSVLDAYGQFEDSLKIPVNNGFAIGGSYFDSIRGFLGDDLNGFLVAGMIFEEFAGITFFHKLIITSCAVGLIGTLLGMALNVQSYSVAQRRREEAAQANAYRRMERSCAA